MGSEFMLCVCATEGSSVCLLLIFNVLAELGGLCEAPAAEGHPDLTTDTVLALQIAVPVGGM